MLLDRGWGKAPQSITGTDGEGDIKVTIRHILEYIDDEKPVIIDGAEVRSIDADTTEPSEIEFVGEPFRRTNPLSD